MTAATQQAAMDQLVRIGAIDPGQADLAPAACGLVSKPRPTRPDLAPMAQTLRHLLRRRHDGLTANEIRAAMPEHLGRIDAWPELHLERFAIARMAAQITAEGRIRLPGQKRRTTTNAADMMVRALQRAGDCMRIERIEADARELAKQAGLETRLTRDGCATILHQDDRFRWVGQATYGLASWDVGHSRPEAKSGKRTKISDEILYLMQNRTSMPMTEVTEHFGRRFRIGDNAVPVAIYYTPGLAIRNGMLVRTTDGAVGRKPDSGRLSPDALRAAREARGLTRAELAQRSGVTYERIHRYEEGIQQPHRPRLLKLAAALEVEPDTLLVKSG